MTKTILTGAALCCVVAALTTGCNLLEPYKGDIHAAIVEAAETQGREAALECIDQLVAAGQLGAANAEKLKAALNEGIEKLKAEMAVEE